MALPKIPNMICIDHFKGAFNDPPEGILLDKLRDHFKLLDTDGHPNHFTKAEYEKICVKIDGRCVDRKSGKHSWENFYNKFIDVVKDAEDNLLINNPSSLQGLYRMLYPGINPFKIDYWVYWGPLVAVQRPDPTGKKDAPDLVYMQEGPVKSVAAARINCKTWKRMKKRSPLAFRHGSCEDTSWGYALYHGLSSIFADYSLRCTSYTSRSYTFSLGNYKISFVQDADRVQECYNSKERLENRKKNLERSGKELRELEK